MSEPLLRVADLAKHFPVPKRKLFQVHRDHLKAVDGISFTLDGGTTLGLVGESGCGKSTTARLVLRLVEPSGGTVRLDGVDVLAATRPVPRRVVRQMQIRLQEPPSPPKPRIGARAHLAQPLRL